MMDGGEGYVYDPEADPAASARAVPEYETDEDGFVLVR